MRFLIAVLAFNTEKDRSWRLDVKCPYCGEAQTLGLTRADFPPVTVLDKDAPYPLTIFDGVHTWALGFATVESMERFEQRDPEHKNYVEIIAQYVLKVDEETDPDKIVELLGSVTEFSLITLMLKTVEKYFSIQDTYKIHECPKCKKKYRVPLSALRSLNTSRFLTRKRLANIKLILGYDLNEDLCLAEILDFLNAREEMIRKRDAHKR